MTEQHEVVMRRLSLMKLSNAAGHYHPRTATEIMAEAKAIVAACEAHLSRWPEDQADD